MKLLLITCFALVTVSFAAKVNLSQHKGVTNQKAAGDWDNLEDLLHNLDELDDVSDDKGKIKKKPLKEDDDQLFTSDNEDRHNPCEDRECGWGKECMINKKGEASCECIRECPQIYDPDPFDKVCSSQNETFGSLCELYRERCMCKRNEPGCDKKKHAKAHLEYLGSCKVLEECSEDTMKQFSERMSDWLFHTMLDMKDRQELHGEQWLDMLHEAEEDDHLKHVYPVLWKFCDLDIKPHDRQVSKHELIPITAPVVPMESCIRPFLAKCDKDKDDIITINEWGNCLGLQNDEISERC